MLTFFADRRGAGAGSSSNPQSSSFGLRLFFAGASLTGAAGVSSHRPRPSRSSFALFGAGFSSSSCGLFARRRVERTCTSGSAVSALRGLRTGWSSSDHRSSFFGVLSSSSDQLSLFFFLAASFFWYLAYRPFSCWHMSFSVRRWLSS